MNVSVLRKCFVLLCGALVFGSAIPRCSGASLVTFSLKPIIWTSGTPHNAVLPTTERVLSGDISTAEMSQLSKHDIVLIIDKSHSMAKKDCARVHLGPQTDSMSDNRSTSAESRWEWCREQTLDLRKKTQDRMPKGVSVVLFSGEYVVFDNIDAKAIESIFTDYVPKGSTNTTAALKSQLDQYFARRESSGQSTKPLLIAVITDGCPDDPSKLRYAIIDATRKMKMPDEILITFLQIGNDPNGRRLLEELDSGLADRKAQFDIVNVVPFTELCKMGLARTLVDEISKR